MDWFQIKLGITSWTGLSMDALHVHVGVLAQLFVAALTRRSLASVLPWLMVLGALIANEWFDLAYETWPDRGQQYGESWKDLWNTMLLPTLFLLLSRFVPGLLVSHQNAEPTLSEGAAESA